LTWRQAGIYRNQETLWRDTLAKNPDCWMAQNNLGTLFADKAGLMKRSRTIARPSRLIRIPPSAVQSGVALPQGRLDEAIENYRKAIQINPDYCDALNNLGIALADKAGSMKRLRTITRPSSSIRTTQSAEQSGCRLAIRAGSMKR